MPSLPFSTPSPSPAPSPTLSATPSIVLSSPASGSAAPPKQLHKAREDAAEAYRLNMAKYFAATFNMSMSAALAEADSQLAPRRASSLSEAESYRTI